MQLLHRHLAAPRVKIERPAATVARDEQTVVFPIDTAPPGDTATFSGWPRQVARTLLRFEAICLVGFDDGRQCRRPVAHGAGHEPVAPPETGRPIHADDLRGIAHRARFEHALQIRQPMFFLP